MKCPICNTNNSKDSLFCASCGANLPQKQSKSFSLKFSKSLLYKILTVAVYLLIAVFTITFLYNNFISVTTHFDESVTKNLSFMKYAKLMIGGKGELNPSAVSIALSMSFLISAFVSAAFWIASAVTEILNKGNKGMFTIAVVFSALNLALTMALTPLTTALFPFSKRILASEVNVIFEDLKNIISVPSFIFAGIVIILIITSSIFKNLKNKECANK